MTQELIQEKKLLLTLQDIAPVWKEKLDAGLTEKDWDMLEHEPRFCVVGEAHGWSRRYGDNGEDECRGCCFYAGTIPALNRNIEDRDNALEGFVIHWNKEHVK